ncbi:hypothetical protein HYU09_04385 [Candidatus Woesearchaeota archaeon]|nr:hypothetical protein [Candidatus Woesearchaeota archaeon]
MVKIFDDFFRERKRYFSRKPKSIDIDIKDDLNGIKNELNGYLEAINENTSEIQASYESMNGLNDKMEKLAERIERIELFLQSNSNFIVEGKSFDIKPLTKTEQHVFLVIYALEDEKGLVSYTDISRKTGFPGYVVSEYIARLVEKGIPVIKKYVNSMPYIKLNPDFKRLQAKENILMIDTAQKELVNFN